MAQGIQNPESMLQQMDDADIGKTIGKSCSFRAWVFLPMPMVFL
jgi:hypothetical protein